MQVLALWASFIIIFITYLIASGISIYHIIKFGMNKKTAYASSIVYLVSSFIILAFIALKLINISLIINT